MCLPFNTLTGCSCGAPAFRSSKRSRDDKGRPEIWVPVSRNAGTQHVELRLPQGGWYVKSLSHALIEFLHKARAGQIVDSPKADYHTACSSVKERPGEADHAFAAHKPPETGLVIRAPREKRIL